MSFRPPVGDATTINKGIVQLAGDLGGTAAAPTIPGLSTKLDSSQVGAASGVASLDANGKVPSAQLELTFPVTTVAGRSGDVILTKADIGLSSVDNTSDADKPVSSATQTALNAKAGLSHAHAIADVTSLQSALDSKADLSTTYTKTEVDTALSGKAATAHSHTTASITGFIEDTQDIISTSLAAGGNITIDYDDPSGITTISATPGAGVTDLSTTTTASDVTVVSSTGDDAVLPAATAIAAGVLTAGDKTKLDGIATSATANSSDATLLDRANHTGTQVISTVTGLQTALDEKATTSALTSGLAGKADTSHAHAIADTTGLQTALDGKQAAGSYAAATHMHAASDVSDSTITGRSVLTALDAAAARTAIGAGTSDLALGATGTTAKAGDYVPTWTEVTGKPSTFTPAAHAHPISDVTNLQTTLDSKAAVSHTHTALEVSDSTTTGRAVMTATDAATARVALGVTNTVEIVDDFADVTTPVYGTLYVMRA